MLLQMLDVLDRHRPRSSYAWPAWVDRIDGRATAGHQSAEAWDNLQIRECGGEARELDDTILGPFESDAHSAFGMLPRRVFAPPFNRYQLGMAFGAHADNTIRLVTGEPHRIRTDVSCTLFRPEPDGGGSAVEDNQGEHQGKPPAGRAVVPPATSLHCVEPAPDDGRMASFCWVQRTVSDDELRALLFDLDTAINRVRGGLAAWHPSPVQLAAMRHNPLRQWADA